MKNTNNLTIIYDDACPMCNIYTKAFTKNKWIGARCGFSMVSEDMLSTLDPLRSKNDIPLYDAETKKTVYGVDALMKILSNRFTILKPLFASFAFRFIVRRLYYLVSYNRRVIAGTMPAAKGFDCTPSMNKKYRFIYLCIATLFGCLFFYVSGYLYVGVLLATAIILTSFFYKQTWEYLGHIITIYLISGFFAMALSGLIGGGIGILFSLYLFIYYYAKRLRLMKAIYQSETGFMFGFIFSKYFIEVCKLILVIRAKKYNRSSLPDWLDIPMSKTDFVGSEFYKSYADENQLVIHKNNSKGLCKLSDFNSATFNAELVHKSIFDFYHNTYNYSFKVDQKWVGWPTYFLRLLIRYYNTVVQQFNFNNIDSHKTSDVTNNLIPLSGPKGDMVCWVRQNISANSTMFEGFYQADTLPYDASKTCVTTRFPLKNACLMVKLKPQNETNGNFSFQSRDNHLGGYSFYVVMRYGRNYYVTTLPIKEVLLVKHEMGQMDVYHSFQLFNRTFMKFHYHVCKTI